MMYLFMLMFLMAISTTVYGESAGPTFHSTNSDINTILQVVSDLNKRVEELTKDRENDLNVIAMLEAKIDRVQLTNQMILQENRAIRDRIVNLENLHLQNGQKISTSVQLNKQGERTRRLRRELFMGGINHERNINGNSNENNVTTDTIRKAGDRSLIDEQARPGIHHTRIHTNKMATRNSHEGTPRAGAPTDGSVAFYAFLTADVDEPGDAYTVRFDHLVTNIGNHYNPLTGAFTCPKDGVYVFNWSIGRNSVGFIHSELRINGAGVAYTTTADDHFSTDSSQTAALVLSQGDIITVGLGTHTPIPKLWRLHTSFTGFLIH